jgi:hypothetical protein
MVVSYWDGISDLRLINSVTALSLGFEFLDYLRGFYKIGHYIKVSGLQVQPVRPVF